MPRGPNAAGSDPVLLALLLFAGLTAQANVNKASITWLRPANLWQGQQRQLDVAQNSRTSLPTLSPDSRILCARRTSSKGTRVSGAGRISPEAIFGHTFSAT